MKCIWWMWSGEACAEVQNQETSLLPSKTNKKNNSKNPCALACYLFSRSGLKWALLLCWPEWQIRLQWSSNPVKVVELFSAVIRYLKLWLHFNNRRAGFMRWFLCVLLTMHWVKSEIPLYQNSVRYPVTNFLEIFYCSFLFHNYVN